MLSLTFAVFAILTGALIFLRLRWPRLSPKTHKTYVVCACAALFLYAFTAVTGWSTSLDHLNAALYWFAIAGLEFFIFLFTILRPQWLTTLIAIILIIPILSTSVFLPLVELFRDVPHTIVSIGPNLISDRAPSGIEAAATSGYDLTIYAHPSWTHLLHHRRQASHYFSSQCNAAQSSATLQPDGKHVLMSCPAAPGQQADAARNLVVKLY